jgi:hypothetical protein
MNYETPVIVFSILPVSTQGLRTPYIYLLSHHQNISHHPSIDPSMATAEY